MRDGAAAPAERLTMAAIVAAAEKLVASEGVESLSMRKLARACDAPVMTLYGYVRTKDDLLAALAERALADVELPRPSAGHWTYRVAAVFHTLRRALLAHPDLLGVVASGRVETLSAYRGAEVAFGALRETGLDDAQIISGLRTLASFTVGAAQHEVGPAMRSAAGRSTQSTLAAPGGDALRNVAALTGLLATRDWDAEFAAGLDLLITGLDEWAENARAAAQAP